SLDDLLRPDVSLAQADAKVAAIGKVTHDALHADPRWDAIDRRTTVTKPTVTDVANAIRVGSVDAGFVWDASVRQVPGIEAMPRPAVEQTLKEFRAREGVEVVTKYNGCGILVADMRGGERPDAYFACDKSFMDQVSDLFIDAEDVSTNRLVILVHKGNPHGV